MTTNLESKAEQTAISPRTTTKVYLRSELPAEFKKWQREFRKRVLMPAIKAYQDSQRKGHALYDRPVGYAFG
jgi:hypothetical protein